MSLINKFKLSPEKLAESAVQLQNYMKDVSESLTRLEEAQNHNTVQIGGFLKSMAADIALIKDKLGIQGDDTDAGE